MELRHLCEHLEDEIELYKDFISMLHKETESIVSRDYKALYEITATKEVQIKKLDAMRARRALFVTKAAEALGIKGDISLHAIIENSNQHAASKIEKFLQTLMSLAHSIKEINELNSLVVKGALENVNKTLGLFGGFAPSSTYNPSGAMEGPSIKGSRLCEGA